MKKMTDELKSFFAQEISASVVNVTTSINNRMNRKFNQLNNRLNEMDTRVNQTKTLAENNTSRLEQIGKRKQDYKLEVRRIFQKGRAIRRAC